MLSNQPFLLEGAIATDHACLLLHGLGGGVYEMQPLAQHLHQHGLTVQGINYPGHDRPSPKMPASTWRQWYDHVVETYEKLSQQYAHVSVIGFSTGCPLAIHLAAIHPIHKLILLSPYMAIRHQWYYLLKPEAYLFSIGHWVADLPRLQLPVRDKLMRAMAEEVAFFKTFNLPAVRSANELIAQVKNEIPSLDTPTLIIQSRQDSVVDPAGAAFIYEYLGSKEKKLVWLSQSDHIIPLDVEREQVFRHTAHFLTF